VATTLRPVVATLPPVLTVPSRITLPSTTTTSTTVRATTTTTIRPTTPTTTTIRATVVTAPATTVSTTTTTVRAPSTTAASTTVVLPPLVTVPTPPLVTTVTVVPQSSTTQATTPSNTPSTVRVVSDGEAAAAVATTPNNVQDLSLPVFVNNQLPEPDPAQPVVIQTENDVTVQVVTVNNQVVTVADETGYRLAVAAVDESGAPMPVAADGALLVPRNLFISINGQGLQPNSVAVAWVFSEPRRLGDVRVAGDGSFSAKFRVPRGLPEGDHTTQVNGVDANGGMRSFNLAIEVVASSLPDIVPAAMTHTSDPADAVVLGSLGVQAQQDDRVGYLLLAVLLLVGSAWFANGLRLKRRDLESLARMRHATAGARRS